MSHSVYRMASDRVNKGAGSFTLVREVNYRRTAFCGTNNGKERADNG